MSEASSLRSPNPSWTIVYDDRCPVVQRLGWLVRQWDRENFFRFVSSDTRGGDTGMLQGLLSETPWSLLLIDEDGNTWSGPEAVPFILKNLPSGKIAAVAYTVPGTMWLTRQLYMMVSKNRHHFNNENMNTVTSKDAA